jgi:FAD/FMN-containing dehydrogenase
VTTSPSPSVLSIRKLSAAFRGRVIGPDDADYDKARSILYGGFDRRPAAIIRVADAAEVARVIALARETGLELAVRSGGHSNAGHSTTEGGMVLDLVDLKEIQIDPNDRTAWAETGLTALEVTSAAAAHELAVGFGDTGSVGIGGITLGGGVGYLARKHGLTIDSLLAADLVTADGEQLRVDAESHPDLFWAIRGGGGNFGVATRFLYRLHPVSTVVGGMLVLPATPDVIAGFMAAAEAAPEELSGIANVMPMPPMPFIPDEAHGKLSIMALLVHAGDVEDGLRAVEPFRALATPIADLLHPMPYPEIYPPDDPDYHPLAVGHTMFVDHIGHGEAESIVEHLNASDATLRVAQLRVLGGAVARVPVEATAYGHRSSRIMVNVAAFHDGTPADRARRQAWVDEFAGVLNQGDDGAYVNFLAEEGPERVRAAYPGATWDRLVAVKRRYDPDNVFHLNQNIPSEAS